MKPGQKTLDRDFYKDATQEKPSGRNYLENFGRFGSNYNKQLAGTVKPGDYSKPLVKNAMGRLSMSSFSHFYSKL
jgi:hypothetical protein